MFERFTERARQVVVLAQEEARHLGHNYVGTEHILLGLLREQDGIGAHALERLGVTVERVRADVRRIIGFLDEPPSGQLPFTPRAKKVLELSLREALGLGHDYLGTGHLLLGLIAEGQGVATHVLQDLGVDVGTLHVTLLQTKGWEDERDPTWDERLLVQDVARRAVVMAAEAAAAAGRRVDAGDLIVALAQTDELAGEVLARHVPLDRLAAELEAARKPAGD